jgi:hypothetical protein
MKLTYYIIPLLSLLFISCSDEEQNPKNHINSDTYTFFLMEESAYWSENDIIGISVYDSKGLQEYYVNRQYRANGDNSFTPVTGEDRILHPLAGESIDLIAYHPYQEGVLTEYEINLGDQSSQKVIDLLYSDNLKNITNTSTNMELVFDHVLSKVVFNIQISEVITVDDLNGMVVTLENVYDNGTFDLITGSIEFLKDPTSIVMNSNGNISEAIILPNSSLDVGFTINLQNGNTYKGNLPKGQVFSAKKIYSYNVKITHTEIILEQISIVGWKGTGDDVTNAIADEIIYITGDYYPNPNNPATAIGVVFWLKPGTNGKEGKITSFDVGRKSWSNNDFLKHLKTSITTGTENMSLALAEDSELENLPAFQWCAEKGEGWYFPARYELHILQERWAANKDYMDSQIENKGGTPLTSDDIYLSSSESRDEAEQASQAEVYDFKSKNWYSINKTDAGMVRAIKEF